MKRKTIRNHADFLTTYDAPCFSESSFVVKLKPAKIPGDPRYGLIVPKKTFKLATERNRAKRIIRDWIAYNENLMMEYYDYIFVLRRPILRTPRNIGRKQMQTQFRTLARFYYVYVPKKS